MAAKLGNAGGKTETVHAKAQRNEDAKMFQGGAVARQHFKLQTSNIKPAKTQVAGGLCRPPDCVIFKR
jgi:methyl coenzyme M reductase gamma subunit